MNEQCKSCMHNDVCTFKEPLKDAIEFFEKTKRVPYIAGNICALYYRKVNIRDTEEQPQET